MCLLKIQQIIKHSRKLNHIYICNIHVSVFGDVNTVNFEHAN